MRLARIFKKSASRAAKIPRSKRVFAVGDVHGRDDLLVELLAQIEADIAQETPRSAVLVFLGDLIDRGPDSREVIERLRTLQLPMTRMVFLAGNHEEALLRILEGDSRYALDWLRFGGRQCIESYGFDAAAVAAMSPRDAGRAIRRAIPAEHGAFLRSFGDTLSIGDYLFVHAGIRPGVPLARQDQADLRWIREPFLDDERDHGFVVVHGHTISDGVIETHNRIGIDTGAYATGRLTALGLEGDKRWLIETTGSPG